MTYTETDLVAAMEQLAAEDVGALSQPQLDGIDQFHAGGAEAVERLLPSLCLDPTTTVLDVGSGLGGPARQVARSSGCAVVGVDLTASYVDAATTITEAAGLEDSVRFLHTDVADLKRRDFDAAFTIHVQMNVEDKPQFFAGIADHLRPGARLAMFDVCRTGSGLPNLPLPWSIDGTDSFLATPDELVAAVETAGFETVEWVDESAWVLDWFVELGARLVAAGTGATLPALLDNGPARMINFAAAVSEGVLSVHRGAFRLAS